ncbi:MAG: PilZ domain-containing protein [Gammaproteobacteria bacterium]|nr:PilZ domain-containing protein [Gammaproteobacteria bacterium]
MDKQHFAIDRKHERIKTSIPCRLGLPGAQLHDATIINLSVGGLKVECDLATYTAIIPAEQHTPGQVADVSVCIKFSLHPTNRRAMNMDLNSLVIHTERLAQDTYHIGIQFSELRKTDYNRLESHIEEVIAASESGSPAQ